MTPAQLQEAVSAARRDGARPELEASGGVTLENVAEVAASGVDNVSVGALTHSAPALDLSMTIEVYVQPDAAHRRDPPEARGDRP
jgi:nicotinate-nucleotide pyrophosphorylase (carboxylating)